MTYKKMMLPVLAVIAGAAASAFTTSPANMKALMGNSQLLEEWVYTGSSQANEDESTLYEPSSEHPEIQCSSSTDLVCKIMAPEDGTGDHPDLSINGNPRDNIPAYGTTFRDAE